MPAWVDAGYQEYASRLTQAITMKLISVPAEKRSKKADLKKIQIMEGLALISQVPDDNYLIALEREGRHITTLELSQKLAAWRDANQSISLLIGGPEGLATECINKADEVWSLSKLTLPHPLVRIVVVEQIYRAWSLLTNHPYHR